MRGVYNTRRCHPPATRPNCVSYSHTVRACLIVTVHGSISCTDSLRPARRSTYPKVGLQMLVLESWSSKVGLQKLVFKKSTLYIQQIN